MYQKIQSWVLKPDMLSRLASAHFSNSIASSHTFQEKIRTFQVSRLHFYFAFFSHPSFKGGGGYPMHGVIWFVRGEWMSVAVGGGGEGLAGVQEKNG